MQTSNGTHPPPHADNGHAASHTEERTSPGPQKTSPVPQPPNATITPKERYFQIFWMTFVCYFYWLTTALPYYLGLCLVRLVCSAVTVGDLEQRYVVITGCDSGFGQMLAVKLIKQGVNVFAGCLTEDGLEKLRELCKNNSLVPEKGKLVPLPLDVTSDQSVAQMAASVREQLPPDTGLWALVNNAGVPGDNQPDDWLQMDTYFRTMDVNCFGTVRCVHAFEALLKLERGRVVIVSSILGHVGQGNSGPYNASKFAVTGYAETIRHELHPFGVTVSVIAPGFHNTAITNIDSCCERLASAWTNLSSDLQAQYPKETYLEPRKGAIRKFLNRMTMVNEVPQVVDAMAHAVIGRFPHTKYWVGIDSRWNISLQRFLPADICSWTARQVEKELEDGQVSPPEHLGEKRRIKQQQLQKNKDT